MLTTSLVILGLASVVRAYIQGNFGSGPAHKPQLLNILLVEASLGLISSLLGLLAAIGVGVAMSAVWWLGIIAFVGFWNWSITLWGPILMALNLIGQPSFR